LCDTFKGYKAMGGKTTVVGNINVR